MTERKPVAVKYVGAEPCPVSLGDRRLAKGEIITGPSDVVEDLAKRGDFEAIYDSEPEASAVSRAEATAGSGEED